MMQEDQQVLTNDECTQLRTVHEVLALSAQEPRGSEPKEPYTMRMDEEKRALAEEICARNGSKLSRFMRGCVDELIRGYRP